MSTQFAIPAVGSKVRVTVRVRESYLFATSEWRDTVFEGTVLPNDKWTRPNAFNMTGNKDWRVREIGIDMVHDLEMLDGTVAATVDVDSEVKTLVVQGSKPGVTYTVTKVGNKTSCSCPGFQFRKACRHTAMI